MLQGRGHLFRAVRTRAKDLPSGRCRAVASFPRRVCAVGLCGLAAILFVGCSGGGGSDASTPVDVVIGSKEAVAILARSLGNGDVQVAALYVEEQCRNAFQQDWTKMAAAQREELSRMFLAAQPSNISPTSVTFESKLGASGSQSTVFFRMVLTGEGWRLLR